MERILFEYQVDSRDPIDPDSVWVSVTEDDLTEAVDHYVESLSSEEALELLSEYVYERCVRNEDYGIDLVRDYFRLS